MIEQILKRSNLLQAMYKVQHNHGSAGVDHMPVTHLSELMAIDQPALIDKVRSNAYLFNGQTTPQYSTTSLANIIKEAARRAGINKKVTPHTLRHSFASYLVSIDVNLKKIQEWMGHASSKTTEIYCHLVYEQNPIKLIA